MSTVNSPAQIAANLRAAIDASDVMHQDVAAALGVGKSNLSKMLSGDRRITAHNLAMACEYIGVHPCTILGMDHR